VVRTYDILATWLGKDLLDGVSIETRERLEHLAGHASLKTSGPNRLSFPAFRAMVDRWALADVAAATETKTAGRTATRRRGL
jgi:hypothetical protein